MYEIRALQVLDRLVVTVSVYAPDALCDEHWHAVGNAVVEMPDEAVGRTWDEVSVIAEALLDLCYGR